MYETITTVVNTIPISDVIITIPKLGTWSLDNFLNAIYDGSKYAKIATTFTNSSKNGIKGGVIYGIIA